MVKLSLQSGYCLIEPQGPLTSEDFSAIAAQVDPLIADGGSLRGLMIKTRKFPGWEGLDGLIEHMRFVKNHHQAIERIALVTDALIGQVVPKLVRHFVNAEIRQFDYDDFDDARRWMEESAGD